MTQTTLPTFAKGAVITAICPLAADPSVRSIVVEGKPVAQLRESEVERLALVVGAEWNDTIATNILNAVHLAKARQEMMRILGKRSMSRGELLDRLNGEGYDTDVATAVADEAEGDGWIDDEAYARAIVTDLLRRQQASRAYLRDKLRQHRVGTALAEQVVEQALEHTDPVDAAMRVARKRLDSLPNCRPESLARRVAGTLARKGFEDDVIQTVLDRLDLIEPIEDV